MCSNNTKPAVSFECVSMEDRLSEPSSAPCRKPLRLVTNSMFYLSVCCWVADTCKHSWVRFSCSVSLSVPVRPEPKRIIMLRSCCVYGAGILCVLLLIAGIAMALSQVFQKLINNTIKEVSEYECLHMFMCVFHIICDPGTQNQSLGSILWNWDLYIIWNLNK